MIDKQVPSPCLTCTRVRDPKNCENKSCMDWRAWFLERWETVRRNIRMFLEKRDRGEEVAE